MSGEPEELYAGACYRRQLILDEWDGPGRPLTSKGSRGQLKEHPLMRMLREHDLLCSRLAMPLRKAHPGPSPSAVPSFSKPRSTRLKSV